MPKNTHRRSVKTGLPPGSLIHIGEKHAEKAKITLCRYGESLFEENEISDLKGVRPPREEETVTWLQIDGLHDVQLLEQMGVVFGLHPLILEDILNTDQRPKTEDHGDYLYCVLKLFHENAEEGLTSEQISILLGPNWLISLREKEGPFLDPVRHRLQAGKGPLRKAGADYLLHALLDSIVDSYFLILDHLGERIETLEDMLIGQPSPATLRLIQALKRQMLPLRKSVWPLREMIGSLSRSGSPLIREPSLLYFRDVHDHAIQVIDSLETYRDTLSGMLDIYLSTVSNRMNEIMKVLTIIATIFMPLTFLAGVYGMNFKHMPELEWPWGYFAIWGVMLLVAGVMLIFFKKRKWL